MDNKKQISTNPDIKTTSTQAANSALVDQPETGKSNKVLLIILTIFLVASLGTSGVFAYLYFRDSAQSSSGTPIPDLEATTNTVEGNSAEDASPISLTQVEDLLKSKYKFDPLQMVFIDGWPKFIKNLNQTNKILFTVYQLYDKFGSGQYVPGESTIIKNISFDDFNNAYNYYFGNIEPLEKKDYELESVISKIIYRSEDDSLDVYFPDGIGGYSTTRMLSKVNNIVGTRDGFKATISTVTLDSNVRQNAEELLSKSGNGVDWFYEIPMTDETLEEIRDSLSIYEFNFIDEAGEYKLASINKI